MELSFCSSKPNGHVLSESGDAGLCYIAHDGDHVGLNNCRLKIWASAIVSSSFYKIFVKI